jgi:thioredoxin-like negative regulator of GroEL
VNTAVAARPSEYEILYFWAPWCGPCKMSGLSLDRFEAEQGATTSVRRINVDEHPSLVRQWQVASIPAILIVSDAEARWRWSGTFRSAQLHRALEECRARDIPQSAVPAGAPGQRDHQSHCHPNPQERS